MVTKKTILSLSDSPWSPRSLMESALPFLCFSWKNRYMPIQPFSRALFDDAEWNRGWSKWLVKMEESSKIRQIRTRGQNGNLLSRTSSLPIWNESCPQNRSLHCEPGIPTPRKYLKSQSFVDTAVKFFLQTALELLIFFRAINRTKSHPWLGQNGRAHQLSRKNACSTNGRWKGFCSYYWFWDLHLPGSQKERKIVAAKSFY